MTILMTEIIGRSAQGITQPFICRGEDGDTYFVKGAGAGRRSQICEWVAGRLGQELGLPIAHFEIVEVPEELLEYPMRPDLSELGVGAAFGSRKHTVTELTYAGISEIPLKLQQDILAFDWWIRNGDRNLSDSGGNPNLFWEPGAEELVVLDHNQAFDPAFSEHDFFDFHVFSDASRLLFSDWELRNAYSARFTHTLNEWQKICDTIPQEWWFADAERTVQADFDPIAELNHLMRCQTNKFWNTP